MPISRLFLTCTPLLLLGMFAGCASSDDRPSRSHVARGGISVLVDGSDHPASARVLADIGAYAQQRGFVRQPARSGPPLDPITGESLPAAPQLYALRDLEMEVSYQPATHRISAYLHGGQERDRKFIETFYHSFDREYAPRYGGEDPISEIGFSDNSGRDRPTEENGGRGHGIEGTGGQGGPGDVHTNGF